MVREAIRIHRYRRAGHSQEARPARETASRSTDETAVPPPQLGSVTGPSSNRAATRKVTASSGVEPPSSGRSGAAPSAFSLSTGAASSSATATPTSPHQTWGSTTPAFRGGTARPASCCSLSLSASLWDEIGMVLEHVYEPDREDDDATPINLVDVVFVHRTDHAFLESGTVRLFRSVRPQTPGKERSQTRRTTRHHTECGFHSNLGASPRGPVGPWRHYRF